MNRKILLRDYHGEKMLVEVGGKGTEPRKVGQAGYVQGQNYEAIT